MPNNKRKNPIKNFFRNNKVIKNNFDLLNKSLNDIYSNTYSDPKDNLTSAKKIRNNIDNHIDNILDKTYTNNSIGNITKLYSKLAKSFSSNLLARVSGNTSYNVLKLKGIVVSIPSITAITLCIYVLNFVKRFIKFQTFSKLV